MRIAATAIAAALLATAPMAGGAFAQTASPQPQTPEAQAVPDGQGQGMPGQGMQGQGQGQGMPGMQNQGQGQGMQGMQGQQQATQFSDDQLKSFAAAVEGIQQVANDYAPRLRDAQDPQQLAELQQEAEDQMLEAVQGEGLTVDEYNAIAVTAQTNPQVAETIRGYITENGGSAPQQPQ